MKKISFLDKILYFLNSLFALLLLLSYLLPYISPKNNPLFAILSLLVPVLLIINIIFTLYWFVKLKKQLLTSLVILIIGFFIVTPFYKITEKNTALNSDLKVMSYNVRMFNHWQWKEEKAIYKKIFSLVKNNNPDILAIQENMSLPEYDLGFPFKHIKKRYAKGRFGIAIYSKFPIINKGFLEIGKTGNQIIFADILKKNDTIRVYNLHLQSLNIKPDKENFGQENSEKLIKILKKRFKQQAEQTEIFLNHQKQWKGKIIVCGDFNNTAYSWVYQKISQDKKDAFIEAGKGFGKTFDYFFPMRIDFILTDETANINQFKTLTDKFSDHFPISARINWQD